MTEHLPECECYGKVHSHECALCIHSHECALCICDRLRACEQRVLDAARKALVTAERRLHFDGETNRWIVEIYALAAIDALREKP